MTLPRLPRWLAPVLVASFLLLTGWASYNLAEVASASASPGNGPLVSFNGTGGYSYNASLLPNTLFNATYVDGSNVTLFVSITTWINVTVVTTLSLDTPAAAGMNDRFTVTLSTPAWTKTLARTSHSVSAASTRLLTVSDLYAINVSAVESLAASIDAQLNYTSNVFTLRLASTVSGVVSVGSDVAPTALATALNLTFRGPQIAPSGSSAKGSGSVTAATASDPPSAGSVSVASVELALCLVALGAAVWLLWAARPAPGGPPDLDRLIEPYEEVIARTTRPPEGARVMPVDAWEDLVKVADTLGRPILRPVGGPTDPRGSEFYVFDGTVAYLYRHPGATTGGPAAAAPVTPPPRPATSPWVPASSPRPSGAVGGRAGPQAARGVRTANPSLARELAEELRGQLARIREAPLDPGQRWYLYSLFTTATSKIATGTAQEAQWAVDDLRRVVDRFLGAAAPSG